MQHRNEVYNFLLAKRSRRMERHVGESDHAKCFQNVSLFANCNALFTMRKGISCSMNTLRRVYIFIQCIIPELVVRKNSGKEGGKMGA